MTPSALRTAGADAVATTLRWGRGARAEPPVPSLRDVLRLPLERDPGAEALVVVDAANRRRSWTYRELDADVRARAIAYAAAGVRAGDVVGLVAARTEPLVPSLLALLRLGATYVPLDPAAPAARWRTMAATAGMTALTGPAALLDERRLELTALPWEHLAPGGTRPQRASDTFSPHDPAYVMFTSGSTGVPKGVMVSHANVLVRVASYLRLSGDPVRYLLHSSLCFDGAVGGMFSTLVRGGCLVLPSDEAAQDPALAAELVRRERVTHLEPVPSWYAELLHLAGPQALDSVRCVILGGEVLPPALVEAHRTAVGDALLVNDYGPTEATVAAAYYVVPDDWSGDRVPIGGPHANTSLYVLDDNANPLGPGVTGQLWIGGPGVALGYAGRPADPAFAPDPFTSDPNGRMYATGDLAAWRPDGTLEFRGRADRQVKVRGQRVEPDEVEAALASLPGVAMVAVEVDRAPTGDRLIGYVSPRRGADLTRAGVLSGLAAIVPRHLVPDLLHVLDDLPLTQGGKVDRPALSGLVVADQGDPSHEQPRTAWERRVADAFGQVLGRTDVGRGDDFFLLGGQSLAAGRVLARLREHGVEVALPDLFREPTVAGLADVLSARPLSDNRWAPVPAERPQDETWRSPVGERQQSFWLLESMPGTAGLSNLVECLTFPSGTTAEGLRGAVSELTRRHAALRTGFELSPTGLEQVVAPAVDPAWTDLGAFPTSDALREAADRFGLVPFDLGVPGLVRAAVASEPAGVVLVLVVHHAVCDGWSTALLVDELSQLVAGSPLPPPAAVEFADCTDALRRRITDAGAGAEQALAAAVAESVELAQDTLPYDRPSTGRTTDSGWLTTSIDAGHIEALRRVAALSGGTLFHALLAAWAAALRPSAARDRVVLSSPLSGREQPGEDRVVGCFIGTGLYGVDLSGDPTFTELVARVVAESTAMEQHRWFPLDLAERAAGIGALAELAPIELNILELPEPTGPGALVERHSRPTRYAYNDVDVYLTPGFGGYAVEVVYHRSRLDADTVARLVGRWTAVVELAAESPGSSLGTLVADGDALPADAFTPAPPLTGTVVDALVDWLVQKPDAPALISQDGQVSRQELVDWASEVSRRLGERGVSARDRVAVRVETPGALLAAVIGCWQLGAVPVLSPARTEDESLVTADSVVCARSGEAAGGWVWPSPPVTEQVAYEHAGIIVDHDVLRLGTEVVRDPGLTGPALLLWGGQRSGTLETLLAHLLDGRPVIDVAASTSPEDIAAAVQTAGVEVLSLPAVTHRQLLEDAPARQLATLRRVTVAGDGCHPSLVTAHHAVLPSTALVREQRSAAVPWAGLTYSCQEDDQWAGRLPLGQPLPGFAARVAGPDGTPCPYGVTGPLLLAVGDPSAATVDWRPAASTARRLDDGGFELVGDGTVLRLGGLRVDTEELTAAATSLDDVVAAAVGARSLHGRETLVLWAVVLPGSTLTSAAIRAHAAERVPAWSVPAVVMPVDRLPLDPYGHCDVELLPDPQGLGTVGLRRPDTARQARILSIWESLLGRPVGIDEDFFQVGGHSLLAARMVATVREEFGVPVSLAAVLASPTVLHVDAAVGAALESPGITAAPDESGPADGLVPLAPHAARLWVMHRGAPDSTAYHETVVLQLVGDLDEGALHGALRSLTSRHAWLRSRIVAERGIPYQAVDDRVTDALPFFSRATVADAAERTAWLEQLSEEPFDLASDVPWRVGLCADPDGWWLALVCHHVAFDGRSIEVLLDELSELYAGGRVEELPPVLAADRAAALLVERAEDGRGAAGAWAERLGDVTPDARVGRRETDRPLPDEAGPAATVTQLMSPELSLALRGLADLAAATPFAVLLAAIGSVLRRFTGASAAIGVPVDLRWTLPQSERLVGFLVETALLPVLNDPAASPLELILAAHAQVLDAMDVVPPLDEVVTQLRSRGMVGRGTPVQCYANLLDDDEITSWGGGALQAELVDAPRGAAKFDLSWTLLNRHPEARLQLEYDAAAVGDVRAHQLLEHVVRTLEAMAASPHTPMARLDVMPAAERAELERWGGQSAERPELDLWSLLEDGLGRAGAGLVDFDGGEVTGGELLDRAARLAAALLAAGVRPGDAVGVSSHRCPGMVVAVLAVLRAGAHFVPVDRAHPDARQRQVAVDAAVVAVVGDAGWAPSMAAAAGASAVVIDDAGRPETQAPDVPVAARTPESRAYVLYTSGSTGAPKGVVVSDSAVVARVRSYQQEWPEDQAVRWLLSSTLAFDASVYLFWALAGGGVLVLPSQDQAADPRALESLIRRHRVSHAFFVPTLYELVLAAATPGSWPDVRRIFVGGEVFPPALAQAHAVVAGQAPVHNVYGPTETVVTATSSVIAPGDSRAPIGRPHPGTVAVVGDPEGNATPAGVIGELLLGGPAVADGYHGDPAMTAARFRRLPHRNGRWYATGDRVRWGVDGRLEFVGRSDRQVKIRGQRLELDELEAALRRQPGVNDAAAVVEGEGLSRHVVAAVSGSVSSDDVPTILATLSGDIPSALVPSSLLVLDALPVLPSGKVDRSAVASLASQVAPSNDPVAGTAAASYLERRVAGTMAKVLGVPEVGAEDDFFSIGGHSLLAARLVALLGEELGFEVPLSVLAAGASPRIVAAGVEGGLARLMAGPAETARVIPVRADGTGTPLLVIARDGEATLYLRHLLREHGIDRPLWVVLLPVPPLGPGVPDLQRQARLAAAAIREELPDGPVHLVGHSASGIVALEVSRLLRSGGTTVLLDTLAVGRRGAAAAWNLSNGLLTTVARTRLRLSFVKRHGRLLHRAATDPQSLSPLEVRAVRNLQVELAASGLRAEPCDQPVLMITAQDSVDELGADLGWGDLLSDARYVCIPGDHQTILIEPYVTALARTLLAEL